MSKPKFEDVLKDVLANQEFVQQALENRERIEDLLTQGKVFSAEDIRGMTFEEIAAIKMAGEPKRRAAKPQPEKADAPRRGRPPGSKNVKKAEKVAKAPKKKEAAGDGRGFWGGLGAPDVPAARKMLAELLALSEDQQKPRKISALRKIIGEEVPQGPKGGTRASKPRKEASTEATGEAEPKKQRFWGVKPTNAEEARARIQEERGKRGTNRAPRLITALENLLAEFEEVEANETAKTEKVAAKARKATRAAAGEVVQGENSSSKRLAHG